MRQEEDRHKELRGQAMELFLEALKAPQFGLTDLVGTEFIFSCEHGSHHHVIAGTIIGLGESDEGGLSLYVSVPAMWGKKLLDISYSQDRGGKWCAVLDTKPEKAVIPGSITFPSLEAFWRKARNNKPVGNANG